MSCLKTDVLAGGRCVVYSAAKLGGLVDGVNNVFRVFITSENKIR